MTTTRLHLLRHADAGDPERWNGPDAARPLSVDGHAQAERLGAHLARMGFTSDVIVTSPKRRAAETAEDVAAQLGVRVVVDDRLAGAVSLEQLDKVLAAAGNPREPIVVGHDPDFSDLLASLTGADLSMKKGAFARLEVRRPLAPGTARLRWLLPPDALRPG